MHSRCREAIGERTHHREHHLAYWRASDTDSGSSVVDDTICAPVSGVGPVIPATVPTLLSVVAAFGSSGARSRVVYRLLLVTVLDPWGIVHPAASFIRCWPSSQQRRCHAYGGGALLVLDISDDNRDAFVCEHRGNRSAYA